MADDDWLERAEGGSRQTLTEPARYVRGAAGSLTTTPGKIVAMMVVLTLALLAAGISMSQSMAARQRALDTLITSTEPMAASAHALYASLSQADTVSTTAFVQPGLLTKEQMELYWASIDKAAVYAAEIHEGATRTTGVAVTEILRDLPVYTGLMERAKVNQRLGNPVGVAYMTEASAVMREQMLARADELAQITQQEVAKEVRRLSSPQWVPLSGLVAALVFLLIAQVWLWRTFRRRFNRGFLAATAAIVIAIGWVGVSSYQSWQNGVVGYERAVEPWQQLASARIDAQEARTDETLTFLARQSVSRSAGSFAETQAEVSAALDTAESLEGSEASVAAARGALADWAAAHEQLTELLASGRFDAAIDLLNAQPGSASAYAELDRELQHLKDVSRESTRAYINASLDATLRVSTAVALLTVVAVVCIWAGIRRRLGEYYR